MKFSSTLFALCAAGTVLAGPVQQKHAKLHHNHHYASNITHPGHKGHPINHGSDAAQTSTTLQGAEQSSALSTAAQTAVGTTSDVAYSYTTVNGNVKTMSPVVETITRIVTSTMTYTLGAGKTAHVTTTQYPATITEYVTAYVTVVMTATSSDSPDPTSTGTATDAEDDASATASASEDSTVGSSSASYESSTAAPVSADTTSTTTITSTLVYASSSNYYNTTTVLANATTAGNSTAPVAARLVAVTSKTTSTTNKGSTSSSSKKPSSTSTKSSSTSTSKKASSSSSTIKTSPTSTKTTSASSTKKTGTTTAVIDKDAVSTTSSKSGSTSSTKSSSSSKASSTSSKTSSASSKASSTSSKASSSSSSKKSTTSTSVKTTSSTCTITVSAPTTTGTGTVADCIEWYVAKSGDYCYSIATAYDINVDTFMDWNPSVGAPDCQTLYAGWAYCVEISSCASSSSSSGSSTMTASSTGTKATTGTTSSSAAKATASSTTATSTVQSTTSSTTSSSASSTYTMFTGNGTVAAGWPAMSEWLDFDTMWEYNVPIMEESCANWDVADDTASEIAYMKTAVQAVANASGVDERFILAIIMQESNGCVRVVTTSWSVENPGLMQSHDGAGTCNNGTVVQDPCPDSEILQMIEDGTEGTSTGDGLKQCIAEADVTDVSKYYRGARIYNGGYTDYNADNLDSGCCTLCYATDVANRLIGWHTGDSGCTLS